MRVVVTGAGGFVGRHLVKALLDDAETPVAQLVHLDRTAADMEHARIVSVTGDIADPACRARALAGGADCIFHLAAVPGGLSEQRPDLSTRVNLDATLALAGEAASLGARFLYASTIAVLGMPEGPVSDATTPLPVTVYGRHKLTVELALADLHRSQSLRCASLRLPGIVARPRGAAGLKSAFMSDLFHALRRGEPFLCPVSPAATVWLMSVRRAAANLVHAARPPVIDALGGAAITLPAIRTSMGELSATVAKACHVPQDLVDHAPDEALEAIFGRLPELVAGMAEHAGFRHDGTLDALVGATLEAIDEPA